MSGDGRPGTDGCLYSLMVLCWVRGFLLALMNLYIVIAFTTVLQSFEVEWLLNIQ